LENAGFSLRFFLRQAPESKYPPALPVDIYFIWFRGWGQGIRSCYLTLPLPTFDCSQQAKVYIVPDAIIFSYPVFEKYR
jgi:hypothetical protein